MTMFAKKLYSRHKKGNDSGGGLTLVEGISVEKELWEVNLPWNEVRKAVRDRTPPAKNCGDLMRPVALIRTDGDDDDDDADADNRA